MDDSGQNCSITLGPLLAHWSQLRKRISRLHSQLEYLGATINSSDLWNRGQNYFHLVRSNYSLTLLFPTGINSTNGYSSSPNSLQQLDIILVECFQPVIFRTVNTTEILTGFRYIRCKHEPITKNFKDTDLKNAVSSKSKWRHWLWLTLLWCLVFFYALSFLIFIMTRGLKSRKWPRVSLRGSSSSSNWHILLHIFRCVHFRCWFVPLKPFMSRDPHRWRTTSLCASLHNSFI